MGKGRWRDSNVAAPKHPYTEDIKKKKDIQKAIKKNPKLRVKKVIIKI